MNDHEDRKAAEAAKAVANILQMLTTPQVLEEMKMKAQYRRQLYLSYIAAGFGSGQALYLCHQKD